MKVFQIGFNKCATLSFYNFFTDNGYESIHWNQKLGRNTIWNDHFQNKLESNKLLCSGAEDVIFWTDITYILRHFEIFALQYPESKFIYNTRPLDEWIFSRRNHFNSQSLLNKWFIDKYCLNDHSIDVEQYWKCEWVIHKTRIDEFFRGVNKHRLLVFDITKDNSQKIIDFLPELKFKKLDFPCDHKTSKTRRRK